MLIERVFSGIQHIILCNKKLWNIIWISFIKVMRKIDKFCSLFFAFNRNYSNHFYLILFTNKTFNFQCFEHFGHFLDSFIDLIEGMCSHQGETRSEEHTSELQSRENLVC